MPYRKFTKHTKKTSYKNTGDTSRNEKIPQKNFEGILRFTEKRTTVETHDGEIFFIFGQKNRGYVHGDLVKITPTRKGNDGKLPEARIDRLIRRSRESLLIEMRFFKGKKKFWVIEEFGGMTVEIEGEIDIAPKNGDLFLGKFKTENKFGIISLFGNRENKDTQETIILFRNGARVLWPEHFTSIKIPKKHEYAKSSLSEFESFWNLDCLFPKEKKISDRDLFPMLKNGSEERRDFRNWLTITIDGADAKDLDDAISVARCVDGDILLAVHIADVANYVTDGNDIDHEARLRGTSIYTPGKVIPMLPEILSNDRCSLHPGEPKEVLSILMRVGKNGEVKESLLTEGLIESDHRATYDEIWELHTQK